jgi:hypothetical protein
MMGITEKNDGNYSYHSFLSAGKYAVEQKMMNKSIQQLFLILIGTKANLFFK